MIISHDWWGSVAVIYGLIDSKLDNASYINNNWNVAEQKTSLEKNLIN